MSSAEATNENNGGMPGQPRSVHEIPFIKRLKVKLVLSFMLLGYIPITLMATYAYQQAKKGFYRQVGASSSGMAELIQSRVNDEINNANVQLNIASHSTDSTGAPRVYGAEQIIFQLLQSRFRTFLDNQKKTLPIFKEIHAVKPAANDIPGPAPAHVMYSTAEGLEGQTILPDFWISAGDKRSVNPAFVWRDPKFTAHLVNGLQTLLIAVGYHDDDGQPVALIGEINLDYINKIIENTVISGKTVKEESEKGEVFIFFAKGANVLASTVPQKFSEIIPEVLKSTFSPVGYDNAELGSFGDAVIGYSKDDGRFGRVYGITKARTVFAPVYSLRYASVVTGFFLMIILFILGVQISKRITDPIMRLVLTTRNVAEGDLHQSVILENKDEIGILASSFNVMVFKLRESFENSKKLAALEKDLELSGAVQNLLMPKKKSFASGNIDLISHYQSASKLGGDWWWFYERKDGSYVFLIGDVTGHGAGSAMVVAAIAGSFRTLQNIHDDKSIKDFLEILNKTLLDLCSGEYWMTVSAIEVNPKEKKVTWWNAGAPPIFAIKDDGSVKTLLARGNSLGMNDTLKLGIVEETYNKQERYFIFTDGLYEFEAEGGKEFGLARLRRSFSATKDDSIEVARKKIITEVEAAKTSTNYEDDITFMMLDVR
ncbi:MAG: SpoIIE family protein phosphatase [Oligoflexales bacterium]